MKSKKDSADLPTVYRWDWKGYCCSQKWVDYSKLKHLGDEEGTLVYRSKFSNSRYRLYSMSPSTSPGSRSKKNLFPADSTFVLKFKRRFKTFYMEFVDPKLKRQWPFQPFWISKPAFHVLYNGHRLVIVPSANSGMFNRKLDLEMRLLFPSYFKIPVAQAVEGVDYRVVWEHHINQSTFCCSGTKVGHFFIQERILNSLSTLPPPEGLPSKNKDVSLKELFHVQEEILNLDLDSELFLCFSFAMIHVYLDFYATKKVKLFAIILSLILIGIISYDLPTIISGEEYFG